MTHCVAVTTTRWLAVSDISVTRSLNWSSSCVSSSTLVTERLVGSVCRASSGLHETSRAGQPDGYAMRVQFTGEAYYERHHCDVVGFESRLFDEDGMHSAVILECDSRGAFPPNTLFCLKRIVQPGEWVAPGGVRPMQRLLVVTATFRAPAAVPARSNASEACPLSPSTLVAIYTDVAGGVGHGSHNWERNFWAWWRAKDARVACVGELASASLASSRTTLTRGPRFARRARARARAPPRATARAQVRRAGEGGRVGDLRGRQGGQGRGGVESPRG